MIGPAPVAVAGSVVSTESQYEMRKRQMYPPSRRGTRSNLCNRLTSALSEPDDLRRRDLLVPTSLGSNLSQQGLLYEKALAARAQIQAANRAAAAAAAASSNSASSTTSSTTASSTFSPRTSTSERTSLFGAASSDWPFHLARDRNSNGSGSSGGSGGGGRNGGGANASNDGNSEWSFGSLSSSKKWSSRKSDTIREDHEEQHHSMLSSMAALEQAQARLRASKAAAAAAASSRHSNNHHHHHSQPSLHVTSSSQSQQQQQSPSAVLATPPPPAPVAATTKSTEPIIGNSANSSPRMTTPSPAPPPGLEKKQQQNFGQFLVPPSDDGNNPGNDYLSDHSDMSNKGEQPLTGAARRRKRSSAARALKDKIAAETVDFELMKDVTNWLRSLRLHKYSPAFDGLVWQQVVQMTDEDMLRAGVNTLGARRKLLKVFENVMRHCDENVSLHLMMLLYNMYTHSRLNARVWIIRMLLPPPLLVMLLLLLLPPPPRLPIPNLLLLLKKKAPRATVILHLPILLLLLPLPIPLWMSNHSYISSIAKE